MRLTEYQIEKIKELTKEVYGDADVYLFGSRVDDAKKGGDIDLFIEINKKTTFKNKLQLMSKLKISIGDRKIDIVVKDKTAKKRSIFKTAKEEGILL